MHKIDLDNWPRKKHYDLFNSFDYPHFNICAQVEVTDLIHRSKQQGFSLNLALAYLLAHTANQLKEFRYRIRDNQVVEHDLVHPSFTVLADNELFSFCTVNYVTNFAEFLENGERQVAVMKDKPSLEDEPGRDDLLFMTAIPWISFTSFSHPIHLHPVDSVPRFAWGKIFEEGDILKMPLSVQVHHALMDGLHVGKYFTLLQEYLIRTEGVLT